jgi:hypothetical protein
MQSRLLTLILLHYLVVIIHYLSALMPQLRAMQKLLLLITHGRLGMVQQQLELTQPTLTQLMELLQLL